MLPERVRQHAVRPLMGDWVEAAVQLRHADRLGVDDFGDNLGNKSLGVSSDQPILQPFTFIFRQDSLWNNVLVKLQAPSWQRRGLGPGKTRTY